MNAQQKRTGINVRRLREDELDEADRIMRLAFGTFLGLPNPMDFMGDADYFRTRWAAEPRLGSRGGDGRGPGGHQFRQLLGQCGFFGPLTVEPSLWDRGVARALLDQTIPIFDERGVRHRGLFTFGHSPKHISLYQRYGFLPGYLTPVLSKPVSGPAAGGPPFRRSPTPEKGHAAAAAVTGSILEGLDVRRD